MKYSYYLKRPLIIAASLGTLTAFPLSTATDWLDSPTLAASPSETLSTNANPPLQQFSLVEGVRNFDSWVRVSNEVANIRTDPNLNAPILLKAPQKSWFPILSHQGKWYQIGLTKDQAGWVSDGIVEQKEKLHQHQTVKLKKDTKVFFGPDETMKMDRTLDPSGDYIPLMVSGSWIRVVSVATGEVYWLNATAVSWECGVGDIPVVMNFTSGEPLKGKTIVLDPGHGGKDEGAAGIAKPIKERDVNLAVAVLVEKKLRAAGADVIVTRKSNDEYVSLPDRVQIANQAKADLFISIHQNMFPTDPKVRGVNTYYYNASLSQALAKNIESQAMLSLYHDRSQEEPIQNNLFVLDQNDRPSVLIEGCFLSNSTELQQSIEPDFHEKLATGIYHGILQYYGIQ